MVDRSMSNRRLPEVPVVIVPHHPRRCRRGSGLLPAAAVSPQPAQRSRRYPSDTTDAQWADRLLPEPAWLTGCGGGPEVGADGGYAGKLVTWTRTSVKITLQIVKRTDDMTPGAHKSGSWSRRTQAGTLAASHWRASW